MTRYKEKRGNADLADCVWTRKESVMDFRQAREGEDAINDKKN